MSTVVETPPLQPPYHKAIRALGMFSLPPEWLDRFIREFRQQDCSVAVDVGSDPWDLVVFQARGALELVWSSERFIGSLFVVQVRHPERRGNPADRSVLRQIAARRGAVPLIATFRPGRPLRDRWQIEKA